jgi:hypothetical protein
VGDYSFMPSIEFKMVGDADEIDEIKSESWLDALTFDENNIRLPFIDLEKLSKYLKFHVKFYQQGSEVDNIIFKSDMIPCKKDMFGDLDIDVKDVVHIEKRICFDMESIKDYLMVKNPY